MSQVNRRRFLQSTSTLAAATSLGVFSSSPVARANTPNERPQIAVIGCGGQGMGDGRRAQNYGDIVAVCDVDTSHSAYAKAGYTRRMAAKGREAKIDVYDDYRAIIDRQDIDAIICGTVDHWHVKISAEALKSGKDVYCEKPLTLTVDEGRIISKVVKETGRILQVGTQQRSDELFLKAVAIAHSGRLGKIKKVTVCLNHNPFSKPLPVGGSPATLNWDRWKGPTEDVPYRFLKNGKDGQTLIRTLGDGSIDASNCHKEFRWWLQYSGGKMTDWGAHHVDIAQWIIDQCGPGQGPTIIKPVMVETKVPFDEDGNPTLDDRYNAPHRFTVHVQFPNGVLMEITSEGRNGILVEGTEGRIFVNRGTIAGKPIEDLTSNPLPGGWLEDMYGGQLVEHVNNFFDCIASRKKPASDVLTHIASINTCHLSNIAIRLNRQIEWDAATQTIKGDAKATAMLARDFRKGYEIEI
ncbi:MAG: putative dehydrogenase [Pirellulaceae bacterium]|jgi:predicted dehydrogenase